MILVDSSVWVDHLRDGIARLRSLLHDGEVLCHPFEVGELACGTLRQRTDILRLLSSLPQAQLAEHGAVLQLLEARQLHGRGIGWIDAHLLASALAMTCPLWTSDRRLRAVAASLDVMA